MSDIEVQEPVVVAPPEYRYVTIPIPPDNIREFFTNKNIVFLADYTTARLKGESFLTYLSNVNVPSDVHFTDKKDEETGEPLFTKAMFFEVMKAYFKQRMVSKLSTLNVHAAQILLLAKGMKFEDIPYKTSFDEETLFEFIQENLDTILNWLHFIDSSRVLVVHAITKLREEFKPAENFEIVDDKEYVGHNVVNLYGVPFFMQNYFAIEGATYRESFFLQQFEEYMFGNNRLVTYFVDKNNVICSTYERIAAGDIDLKNPEAFLQTLKEEFDATKSDTSADQ